MGMYCKRCGDVIDEDDDRLCPACDHDWQPIDTAPQGVEIMTRIHDERGQRNVQSLKRRGNLWFVPDGSMYVYYTPTHWRHLTPAEKARAYAPSALSAPPR